ncbi:MAG: asparagine synthetase B [Thermodesulfobacteriota bacterium]|nr:asparagine synthetase B [Thermodesulfobacteriota bacterium]
MCTICGHFVKKGKINSKDIFDMLVKMKHRGPDTHGEYLDGEIMRVDDISHLKDFSLKQSKIALGHSRLKILGRITETQPYTSSDKNLILIHNGEIYNYQKLKSLLTKKHEVLSGSDSEVIVYLLEEFYQGDLLYAVKRMVGLLDGMYTLAVTDGDSIVIARDPIGKKPLYYIKNDRVTYFASEKKALWNGKEDPKRLNPGDLLFINDSGASIHEGFHLQSPPVDIIDFRDAVEQYKEVLTNSMKKRLTGLMEDFLGVIFSGGIDSVLIAQLLQREGKNIICYCTGTEDSGDIQAAISVANELGLELKTTIIDDNMVEKLLPEVIENVEESGLLQVEVAIPMYLAAKMASEDGIKVMYTGQAADELFAGYPWYTDVIYEYGYLRLHEKLWEDLNYLYSDTLEREDKLTMAHSIELRAPYLDRDLINLSMRISPKLKIQGLEDLLRKRVHRQAAVELGVPASLAFRKKSPAQSGSGIHKIIQRIAHKNQQEVNLSMVDKNIERDKGSLYRYGDETYGDEMARTYLQKIEDDIVRKFVPLFS